MPTGVQLKPRTESDVRQSQGSMPYESTTWSTRIVVMRATGTQLYPSLWTWWVPESLVGGLPYALVATVGFALLRTGQRIRALYH